MFDGPNITLQYLFDSSNISRKSGYTDPNMKTFGASQKLRKTQSFHGAQHVSEAITNLYFGTTFSPPYRPTNSTKLSSLVPTTRHELETKNNLFSSPPVKGMKTSSGRPRQNSSYQVFISRSLPTELKNDSRKTHFLHDCCNLKNYTSKNEYLQSQYQQALNVITAKPNHSYQRLDLANLEKKLSEKKGARQDLMLAVAILQQHSHKFATQKSDHILRNSSNIQSHSPSEVTRNSPTANIVARQLLIFMNNKTVESKHISQKYVSKQANLEDDNKVNKEDIRVQLQNKHEGDTRKKSLASAEKVRTRPKPRYTKIISDCRRKL